MSRLTRAALAAGLALLILAGAPDGALARGAHISAASRPARRAAANLPLVAPPDTTTGVFRPTNGNLYRKLDNSTGTADITLDYGLAGDQPVTGDWTGKNYRSIGIYRGGSFYLRNTNTTGPADLVIPFGTSGDIPVVGDWTNKGYESIGVFRPSTGAWYLRNTNTAGSPDIALHFGTSGDLPVVGDWDGDGTDTIGVFRPSTGQFFLRNTNTTGPADVVFSFGASGDLPTTGDWTGKGYDSVGIYRGGRFLLRNSNTTGPADLSFRLGVAGDEPIAGPWIAGVSDVSITTSSPNPYGFSPSTLTIPSGTEVIWTNLTSAPHTASSDIGDPVAFDSGTNLFAHNGTFSVIFITPGTYTYHCNVHAYMHATITVTAAP